MPELVEPSPHARPGGFPAAQGRQIDRVVNEGIGKRRFPGAVVHVQRDGHAVFERGYGSRALVPAKVAMTRDTVFDLASLTKPVATATAIMVLVDRGKLTLGDRLSQHLPGCALDATIAQVLTHRSGLPPANALSDYAGGRDVAIAKICAKNRVTRKKELYSDLGYILLAETVARVSGKSFDSFCRENIFEPLGMRDTAFAPPPPLAKRAAPTERRDGVMLSGAVHDPRAAALDGVAGHAGLFSTAADLAKWADMLLAGGQVQGKRVLSERSAGAFFEVLEGRRSVGLVRSVVGGYGHTGFTGTSLWLDPSRHTALILLASRLHPNGGGDVKALRQQVRKAVLDANASQHVSLGVDVARRDAFGSLAGKRVGLVTNITGRARDGRTTMSLLSAAPNVTLSALFSPEHGIAASADAAVSDGKHASGVPIYSLYGKNRRPTAAQVANVDVFVFDVQSIGARFYTYVTTLGYVLEAGARFGKPVVVFDRPNPVGGTRVEGPVLEKRRESFVGYHPIPVRHGMTLGELASLFNVERKIGATLTVVELSGWKRTQLFADTGLPWMDPSPNIRSPEAALLYPGLALLEMTNVSVGRGTDAPFLRLGAPWMKPDAIIAELNEAGLDGVTFTKERFTPKSSRFANQPCEGVRFTVKHGAGIDAVRLGVALALALRKHHGGAWQRKHLITLVGHQPTVTAIENGASLEDVVSVWQADLDAFDKVRARHLLY